MTPKNPALQPHTSQTGSGVYYAVEARGGETGAFLLNGQIIESTWTRINVRPDSQRYRGAQPILIVNEPFAPVANHLGLLTFEAAIAVCAQLAGMRPGGYCIEFRLVEQHLHYSWSVTDVATGDPFTFMGERRVEKFTPIEPKPEGASE